jgi:hypothetical protein
MNIEIAVYIALVIFAILVFFIIRTLLSLQNSLKQLDTLLLQIGHKTEKFDPLVNSVSHLGEICEIKTKSLKDQYTEYSKLEELKKQEINCNNKELTAELAEWLTLTFLIGKNIFRRK